MTERMFAKDDRGEDTMLVVETYVAPSKIHGLGVFVAARVRAGTLLWVYDRIIDQRISDYEIDCLPIAVRELVLSRSFVDEAGQMILSRDNGAFLNHSDGPTMSACLNESVATRDLKAGDELTEDYKLLPPGACTAFLENQSLSKFEHSRCDEAGLFHRIAARKSPKDGLTVADDRQRRKR